MRTGENRAAYRWAVGIALAAALMLVWLSVGVGIIGQDGDPANAMYFGVLAAGVIGAAVAKLQPHGMARALVAMALAQAVVAGIVLVWGLGRPYDSTAKVLLLNGCFIALYIASAWLFQRAARVTQSS
jgi:hypothetical protein